jgi:hypothetical protein
MTVPVTTREWRRRTFFALTGVNLPRIGSFTAFLAGSPLAINDLVDRLADSARLGISHVLRLRPQSWRGFQNSRKLTLIKDVERRRL